MSAGCIPGRSRRGCTAVHTFSTNMNIKLRMLTTSRHCLQSRTAPVRDELAAYETRLASEDIQPGHKGVSRPLRGASRKPLR